MRSARLSLEQIRGVEPPSSVWETEILTVVLYLHILIAFYLCRTQPNSQTVPTVISYPTRRKPHQFWLTGSTILFRLP